MESELSLEILASAVGTAAAFRCCRTLQPAAGAGTKIFPPTYAGAIYAREKRRLPGRAEPVQCVVVDSVQSQANRMEEALQDAVDTKRISMPIIEVDFSEFNSGLIEPIGRLTSLQVPHRISDAILRDCSFNGVKFRESEWGKRLNAAGSANATPIYQICPTALIFGMWDSTGPKGGLGMKIERAIVSEIVGIGAEFAEKNRVVRRDPLEIRSGVPLKGSPANWEIAPDPKAKGLSKPSEMNHGNILDDSDNAGVTLEYCEQHTTLSLIALRRLQFPISGDQKCSASRTAQVVLTALALYAATSAAEKGLDLRSRCLLWPEGPAVWELLETPGTEPRKFAVTGDSAAAILADAVKAAAKAGITWRDEPLVLRPLPQLVEIVQKSQAMAAAGGDQGKD